MKDIMEWEIYASGPFCSRTTCLNSCCETDWNCNTTYLFSSNDCQILEKAANLMDGRWLGIVHPTSARHTPRARYTPPRHRLLVYWLTLFSTFIEIARLSPIILAKQMKIPTRSRTINAIVGTFRDKAILAPCLKAKKHLILLVR